MRDYKAEDIPSWCRMHPREHFDGLGGCWGISSEQQPEQGESYCVGCEFYSKIKLFLDYGEGI